MKNLAKAYVDGLKKAYYEIGAEEHWDDFEQTIYGAAKSDLEKLQGLYPLIPGSLLQLLGIADGTYGREYNGKNVMFSFLGSDIEEFPYYLLSAEQMCQDKISDWLLHLINREYADEVEIDERITDKADEMCWLHFSDCRNNGGTSRLYIDFSPSSAGVCGQVVRYLHDPDELTVIADSFDAYLQMLMENAYDFITEDILDV